MPPSDLHRTLRQGSGRRRLSQLSISPPRPRPPIPRPLSELPQIQSRTLPSLAATAWVFLVNRRCHRGAHSSLVVMLASLVGVAAAAVGAAALVGAVPAAGLSGAAKGSLAAATTTAAAPVARTASADVVSADVASAEHPVVDTTDRLRVNSLAAAIVIEIEVGWVNEGRHPEEHKATRPCRKPGKTPERDDPDDESLPECVLPMPRPSLKPLQPKPSPPPKWSPAPTARPTASLPKVTAAPKRTAPPQKTASPQTTTPRPKPLPSADPAPPTSPTSTRGPPSTATRLPRPFPTQQPSVSPDAPPPSPSVFPVPPSPQLPTPTYEEEPFETSQAKPPSGKVVGSLPPPPPPPIDSDSSVSSDNGRGAPLGAIIGGSIGGVALVGALVGAVLLSGRRRATASDPAGGEAGAPARSTGLDRGGGEWSAPPLPLTRGAVGGGGEGTDPFPADDSAADVDGRSSDADATAGDLASGGRGPIPPISAEDAAAVAAAANTAAATTAAMMAADATDSDSSSMHPSDWEAAEDSDDERLPRASVGGGIDLGPTTQSSAGEALTFDYIMGAGEATTRSQGRRLRRAAAAGEGDPMAVLGAGGSLASLGASAASLRMDGEGEE